MVLSNRPTRIVIVGGGFGGCYTAHQLETLSRGDIEITLVSRDNYLLMTPLLFEAGSGILEPRHAVYPIRAMLRRTQFIQAEVDKIDLDNRMVLAAPGIDEVYEIPYDHLVLALGGITNRSLVPGSEHAMSFKTLADGIFFRNYIIELFERADVEPDPASKAAMLSFVIIGAGLVGIELCGELTSFTQSLCRTYRNINPKELRYELIEAGPRIMPEMDQKLADYAMRLYRRRGVSIQLDTRVQSIELDRVRLPGGQQVIADTIVLAAGVAPNPLIGTLPLEKDRKGRVAVDATMQSRSYPNVWALGDCASIPGPDGKPYPPLAQHALREAKVLGSNIIASIHNHPLKPFQYNMLGILAALGGHKGVGRLMRLKVRGFLAWWIWRSYYLFQMPGWNRRLRIILDWTIALFFKNDIVKLDLFGEEHPLRKYEQRHLSAARAQRELIAGDRHEGYTRKRVPHAS